MNVLVIYETIEGQTRKVAGFVEDRIRAAGHETCVVDTSDPRGKLSFDDIDKVILAAPVHERRHPKSFEVCVSTCHEDLKQRPTMMISVSLKAAFREGREEAEDYLAEMKMRTGFRPTREILVAGAVRTDGYGYFESQIVKNVVLAGQRVDLVDGFREFTDWEELAAELDLFLATGPSDLA